MADRLPEDIDAERSLLATLCAPGNEANAASVGFSLEADAFVHPGHRAVFLAMLALVREGVEIHAVNLKDKLEASRTLNTIGGYPGLVELLSGDEVGRPQNLADILKKKWRQRQLIRLGTQLARAAQNEEAPPEALVEKAAADLLGLSQGAGKKNLDYISTVGDLAMKRIQDVAEGRALPGLPTGFPKLDWLLGGGFKGGQLILLAARPGVGKTALALQWGEHTATKHATVAAWILEMAAEEVWTRLAGRRSKIPSHKLSTGKLDQDEWGRLYEAKLEIQAMPLLINDQADITPMEIRAQYDQAATRYGAIGLVIVDYLQLMSSPKDGNKQKSEATRVGELSRALKLLAKDRGIPVIVLSQLNRDIEKRAGGRPQLSDLRDSGALEQDADIVAFLHRKPNQSDTPDPNAELILAKHRNGPTGSVFLRTDMASFTFTETERTAPPAPHNSTAMPWN